MDGVVSVSGFRSRAQEVGGEDKRQVKEKVDNDRIMDARKLVVTRHVVAEDRK